MIQSVTVTNHLGESFTMETRSPEKSGFFIRSIEGLGPTQSNVNTTEIASYSGSIFNSSRSVPRNLVFNIGFMDYENSSIESLRLLSYRMFPSNKPLTIDFQTDNRYVTTTGYVESNDPDIFSRTQGSTISIMCPSSYFYDKNLVQSEFAGSNSSFEFPFENPSTSNSLIEFGVVYDSIQRTIYYTGEEETGVKIYLSFSGTVNVNIRVNNEVQGMTINTALVYTLTGGHNFGAGDSVVISSEKGKKYIYLVRSNGSVWNLLNCLTAGYSWPTLVRGDNVFDYNVYSAPQRAYVKVMIENQIVYGGI